MATQANRPRAFALVEVLAAFLVLVPLACALIVMAERSRRNAMASDDLANLRQIGQLTGMYGTDNKDLLWGFNWKKTDKLSQYPDLNNHFDDINAAAHQAIDIIRRRADRTQTSMPSIESWIPHIYFSHLPLLDYAGLALPNYNGSAVGGRLLTSAGDRYRLLWQCDVEGFDQNKFLPYQPNAVSPGRRWPYSASYSIPPHFYSSPSGNAINQQGLNFTSHNVPSVSVGQTILSSIAHPSAKVLMYDTHDRHHGSRQPFHAIATGEARVPLLMVDGSARVRAAKDSNPGWNPTQPTSPLPTTYFYNPSGLLWYPPAIDPSGTDPCIGVYRYTRNATLGRDFGGPEIPYP